MKSHIMIGLAWSLLVIAAMAGITLYAGGLLPEGDRIPLHFGPDGQPDRFGDRAEALTLLWLLPGIMAGVSLVMAIAPLLDPRRDNVRIGRRAYLAVWVAVSTVMLFVHAGTAYAMVNSTSPSFETTGIVRWIIAACAILFIIMGNYLPKTRSSFVFGIRTPWTLSSDLAWEKTHRLAGPLFMLAGGLSLVGAFLLDGIWLALQMTVWVLAAALVSSVYSYLVWRTAEDRDTGSRHLV
ncbi:MAG: SdpI family protein [Pseudomonadota bacterium]|nr:SdpI family protein [Pseudomonadota bacterium]